MAFCKECGSEINEKASICVKCGVETGLNKASSSANEWTTVLLLSFFLGVLGVHRFYTGHTGTGVIQLLTFGGCGIWSLYDFIMILLGKFKDSDGNIIEKN